MPLLDELEKRCEGKCELCGSSNELQTYLVPPKIEEITSNQIAICSVCFPKLDIVQETDSNYWRCLNESMWNPEPAVQVMVYRILKSISSESWAQDALGLLYWEEETLDWAKKGLSNENIIHKDSNGNVLAAGDTVSLIQDLNVKGAGFTAKRGTAIRRIRLVHDNAEHIEGKVEGQQIVILTKFVKKV